MKIRNSLLFMLVLLPVFLLAIPPSNSPSFDEYVKEGTRQYQKLLEYNKKNTEEGCAENNWYIFSFNANDNWLEVSKDGKDYDGNVIYNLDALNAINNELLVPFNANSDLDVQLYICIVSDWFIPVKAQHPEVLINNPNPAIKTQELMLELSTADEKTYKSFVHTSFDLILKSILDNSHQANTQSLYSKEKRVVWGQAEFRSNFFFGQQELSGGLVKRYRGTPKLEVLVDVDELKEYTQYVSLHRTYENFNSRETKIRHIVEGFTEFVGGNLDEKYVPLVDKLKFESLHFIPWNTIPDHLKNTGGGSATYDAAVDLAVEEINVRIDQNEFITPLNEGSWLKYIINHTTTDFSKESSKNLKQLDDKFAYLDHKGGAKFYVYFKRVDFIMPPDHYNVFANEIFVESGLNQVENAVLITLPYIKPKEDVLNVNGVILSNYASIMPGIAYTDNLIANDFIDDAAAVLTPGNKFWEFIKVAFKHTPKPLRVHGVTLLLGDSRNEDHAARLIIQDLTPPEMTGFVTGFFNMNEIYLYRDDRIDMVRNLETQMLNSCMQAADFGEIDFSMCEDLVNEIQAVYEMAESEYGYTKLEFDFKIKEKYLDPDITDLWAGGQNLVKYSILEFKNADRWFDHWWTEFNSLEDEGIIYNTEGILLIYDALDALSLVPVVGEFVDVGVLMVGAADAFINGISERSVIAMGSSALGFFTIGENFMEVPLKSGRKLIIGPCVGFVARDAVAAGTDPVLVKKLFSLESSAPGSTAKKLVDNVTGDGRRLHQVILENDKLWDIIRLMPKLEKRKFLKELSENPQLLSDVFDQSSLTMKPVNLWRKIDGMQTSLAKTAIRNLEELDKIDFYNHLDIYGDNLLNFVKNQSNEIDAIGCWVSIKDKIAGFGTGAEGIEKGRQLFEDLASKSEELFPAFKLNGGLVDAWEVPNKHGDALATDVLFLTKLNDDISNPQFPNNSLATATQLRNAFNDSNIFAFYKKFWKFSYFNNAMRKRYLEVLTLDDAVTNRIPILQNILQRRKLFYDFVKSNYSNTIAKTLKPKNFLYGEATYQIDGVSHTFSFFSVSGPYPSEIIVPNNSTFNFGPIDNYITRDIIPNPLNAFTNGSFDNTKRFFQPIPLDLSMAEIRQWDTEVKAIEIIIEKIAAEKGIAVGNRTIQGFQQIVENTNLTIVLKSEMNACQSCQNIITQFNNAAPDGVTANVQGGTQYYEFLPE